MLMNRGATLINANSKTKDLSSLVKISDIIISCVGKQNLINEEDIKEANSEIRRLLDINNQENIKEKIFVSL